MINKLMELKNDFIGINLKTGIFFLSNELKPNFKNMESNG